MRATEGFMKKASRGGTFLLFYFLVVLPISYVEAQSIPAVVPPAPTDIVTLKDGSVIYGEVVEMTKGILQIKSASAGDVIKIKWPEVVKLKIARPIPFHLKEGTILIGTVDEGEPGTLVVKAEPLQGTMTLPIESVTAVNPIIQPPVIYSGNLQAGYSQAAGNSHLRNASVIGEFTGRSESLRLTLLGRYVYGDDAGSLIVRNSRGTIKLDFFMTKRLYWFASSYFEQDTFQDLKLRTALATGPGYQFIDQGDYEGPWLKDMSLYVEAGASYFNEDFNLAEDKSSFRARWSMKFNWPILDEKVTFYHFDEFFPSLQNFQDYYLTADTGIRFKIFDGFVSSFQWTLRYNSRPALGTTDTDNLYLMSLGYAFDTSRKRS